MNRYKVFLRTDQQNIDGTCTVCLRYVSQRQKSDVSLIEPRLKVGIIEIP